MLGEKIIVVDLNAGSYLDKFVGLEKFNLSRNELDGMYYGYVPPLDRIDISRIQKGAKQSVSGVLVVYVQKKSNETNREIIAYCENATVFGSPQSGEKLNRFFEDNDGKVKCATYSIKSDNLTDLSSLQQKFTIQLSDYNSYLFRSQRSYLEKYPQLKTDIITYIVENKKIQLDNDSK